MVMMMLIKKKKNSQKLMIMISFRYGFCIRADWNWKNLHYGR